VIDLHLHTTASDGRLSPSDLVARAMTAGITTMAVTDHDTVAGLAEAAAAARVAGLRFVHGIEITAVDRERDVHVLGYFIDVDHPGLLVFLERQRALRVTRLREIGARLAALGVPLPVETVLADAAARPGSSVGRPMLGRALVDAGHVKSVQEAFDRFLAAGMPAFVPRLGSSPTSVIDVIHSAGGLASMAHPGVTGRDDLIEPLAAAGLDALEVYHSDHSPEQQQRYAAAATRLRLAMTGGSDFHGDAPANAAPGRRREALGRVGLPPDELEKLEARVPSR
jgi:3',5'-nucleoside bisphosphate phosphatase